jgi:ankyrin repeat protein
MLGTISMIYSGWRLAGPRCDIFSCRKARIKFLEITYVPPLRSVSLSIIASLALRDGEPTIGLTLRRTSNIVDENYVKGILYSAKYGNSSGVKHILEKRSDAVLEVDEVKGFSSLHYALHMGFSDIAKFLLDAGADPFLEDHFGTPAVYYALRRILRGDMSEIKDYLPISAFFEDYNFSHLHRVVLGIRSVDLKIELEKETARDHVNARDDIGKTPLHWAAFRGDISAVDMLLRAGSRVDISDIGGFTALYEASFSNSLKCAKNLLAFGADVNACDKVGYSILHIAAERGTHDFLSLLLANGANLENARNHWKCTPLYRPIAVDNVLGCMALTELGANLQHEDREGDTPLFQAVLYNAHGCLRYLLTRGANHLHKTPSRRTLLHRAASTGDEQTFAILGAANLRGLDPHAKDVEFMTAWQHLNLRPCLPRTYVDAFDALIESLGRADARTEEIVEVESDGDEELFDAVEYL